MRLSLFQRVLTISLLIGTTVTPAQARVLSLPPTPAPAVIAPTTLSTPLPVPLPSIADHVQGRRTARYFLVEYGDLECPFCKKFDATLHEVIPAYQGTIVRVFRHFPLSFHADALPAAQASECVMRLGGGAAFWKFIDSISLQDTSAYEQLGEQWSGNAKEFQSCMQDPSIAQRILENEKRDSDAVSGTPTSFLMDRTKRVYSVIEGAIPAEELRAQLDDFLQHNK